MVVLGVADADRVVGRDAETAQRLDEPGLLRDAGRQHHHRFLDEDDV
jgi:hypothetical protein